MVGSVGTAGGLDIVFGSGVAWFLVWMDKKYRVMDGVNTELVCCERVYRCIGSCLQRQGIKSTRAISLTRFIRDTWPLG